MARSADARNAGPRRVRPGHGLTRARAFYDGVLGLTLTEDTPIAIVFDANGTTLRVTLVEGHEPPGGTVLGWRGRRHRRLDS